MIVSHNNFQFNLNQAIEISLLLSPDSTSNVNAYYAPMPYTQAFEAPGFVGLLSAGSPVNYRHLYISPHGNGTHTECASHIYDVPLSIHTIINTQFSLAYLHTCQPVAQSNGDYIIELSQVQEAISIAQTLGASSFIIRTIPNDDSKKTNNYSGTNPAFMDYKIAKLLNEMGIMNLLVDLPSLDKEQDGGELAAHKAFWGNPLQATRTNATITELIFVPNVVKDGLYGLSIAVPAIVHDALPSRICLYPIQ
jgi:kynurenine formamidase